MGTFYVFFPKIPLFAAAVIVAGGCKDARPRLFGYGCTGWPKGARWTISMRVPQGSVMYVMVLPVGDLRGGSSS